MRITRYLLLLVVAALGSALPSFAHAEPSGRAAESALHMLDYIAVDYAGAVRGGKVVAPDEYQEQLEFAGKVGELIHALPAGSEQPQLSAQAARLARIIADKRDPAEVASAARALSAALIAAYRVPIAPRRVPDLKQGAALYEQRCAGCHGAQGLGDGPLGAKLQPPPANFHDAERQSQRSLYSLYSTITLGVAGTAMPAFEDLTDDQRWALAFAVSRFAASNEDRTRGEAVWRQGQARDIIPNLSALAAATPAEVRQQGGDGAWYALAYLRSEPNALVANGVSPLAFSVKTIEQSAESFARGDRASAQQLAVSAYLEGFELVESGLDAIDSALRTRIEREMLQFRELIKQAASPQAVAAQAHLLTSLLDEAREKLDTERLDSGSGFASSLIILLREGLEAVLVLAAIIAFLSKSGRRDALPYVHAGWVSALALGGVTWVVASHFVSVSGASRELTEGVTALLAAVILLYVGFWLHGKTYADRWKHFIEGAVQGALSRRTLWAFTLVSFLAVYREVFETVLFYEALWVQTSAEGHGAVLAGIGTAAVMLLGIIWLIFRFSVRLPLGIFFNASATLLALLAVVFAGRGVAALQEAGRLPINPVDFPRIPLLGIYPNLQGLVLQLAVAGLIAAGFLYTHYEARKHRQV